MKLLAIDTATERCSVALRIDGEITGRVVDTPRGHADLILPMIDAVLRDANLSLRDLDGIAYGRGPGSFTGVRIAIGVVQGLGFGADLLTVGISDLAAVAQQVARAGDQMLVCMDARMGEVYWASYFCDPQSGLVVPTSEELVSRPENVIAGPVSVGVGTGFMAYSLLSTRFADAVLHGSILPRAAEVALLGEVELGAGRGVPAASAQPVYVRDQVAFAKEV